MPEGHTLHGLAEQLHPLIGRRLSASSPQGRFAAGADILDRRRLTAVEAVGKHLLFEFDDVVLHVHLGMAGSMFPSDPNSGSRPGVRLRLVDEREEVAWNLVAPTRCELWSDDERRSLLSRLGPDPLRGDDPQPAFERISRSDRTIGELLLDQSVIAGVGNVFRAEVLHSCRVHPTRPGRSLGQADLICLWETATALMRRAVLEGRITARSVYKQETCSRCGGPVASWALGARTAYACAACQPL